ncbi:DUF4931 family protein [Heyndrickxia oleronia]|uniref:DUF4931 family protein n=1 Tax=Heyndrickxia oleronia TaxID=38875 RepID=UPI0036F30BBB
MKATIFFFYQIDGQIACKIIPRYITPPLFVGYSIPQVASNLDEIVDRIKSIYKL